MRKNHFVAILISISLVLIQSCAVTKGVGYFPATEGEKCDEVTWYTPQTSTISGWTVPYYIIPLWYGKWDHSSENLKVEIYFKIEIENEDHLSMHDIYLKRPGSDESIYPNSVELTSDIRHETSRFLMYESEFSIAPNELEAFGLHFTRKIYGCEIAVINYKKSEYDFNGQIL